MKKKRVKIEGKKTMLSSTVAQENNSRDRNRLHQSPPHNYPPLLSCFAV